VISHIARGLARPALLSASRIAHSWLCNRHREPNLSLECISQIDLLGILRVVRLLRVVRVLKIGKFSTTAAALVEALTRSASGFTILVFGVTLALIIFSRCA
jgi:hypothetical protein